MIRLCSFPKLIKRRCGFTLLEMVIVLLIVSILFAIAIPSFLKSRERSAARICTGNLRHIQDSKERWAMDRRLTNEAVPEIADLAPNYLKTFPSCPGGGNYEARSIGENARCSLGGDHSLD